MEEGAKPTNSISFAIIIAGIIVAGAIFFINKSPYHPPAIAVGAPQPEPSQEKAIPPETFIIAKDDHILGNPDAPIKIFEYSDFQCPFCKRYQMILKQVMEQYGKTGEVALVYRHFPLDTIHPQARPLAMATECAYAQGGDTAFWKMHDMIMERDTLIDINDVASLAKAIGIDTAKFETCMSTDEYNGRIDRDFTGGVDIGIAGTPISFVHHKDGRMKEIVGVADYAKLSGIIDALLFANPRGAK